MASVAICQLRSSWAISSGVKQSSVRFRKIVEEAFDVLPWTHILRVWIAQTVNPNAVRSAVTSIAKADGSPGGSGSTDTTADAILLHCAPVSHSACSPLWSSDVSTRYALRSRLSHLLVLPFYHILARRRLVLGGAIY